MNKENILILVPILLILVLPFIIILIWNFWVDFITILNPMEHYWQGLVAGIVGTPFFLRGKSDE